MGILLIPSIWLFKMCCHEKFHTFSLTPEPRLYLAAPPNGNKDIKSISALAIQFKFASQCILNNEWKSFLKGRIKTQRDSCNFDAYYIFQQATDAYLWDWNSWRNLGENSSKAVSINRQPALKLGWGLRALLVFSELWAHGHECAELN